MANCEQKWNVIFFATPFLKQILTTYLFWFRKKCFFNNRIDVDFNFPCQGKINLIRAISKVLKYIKKNLPLLHLQYLKSKHMYQHFRPVTLDNKCQFGKVMKSPLCLLSLHLLCDVCVFKVKVQIQGL